MINLPSQCQRCRYYEGGAKTPCMQPSGAANPDLYVVVPKVSRGEDVKGKGFGPGLNILRNAFEKVGVNKRRVRYGYALACHGKSKPTSEQVALCGDLLRQDIAAANPAAVLVLGIEGIDGLWPKAPSKARIITNRRGAVVPLYLADRADPLPAVVTYSPDFLNTLRKYDDLALTFMDDVALAWEHSQQGEETRPVYKMRPRQPTVVCKKWAQVKDCFDRLKDSPAVAYDYETTSLKPLGVLSDPEKEALPFSVAFALDDGATYTVPLYKFWSERAYRQIMDALAKWHLEVAPKQSKIAHQLKFELYWTLVHAIEPYVGGTGGELPQLCGDFHDTRLQVYTFDERTSAPDLKVSAWALLGVQDWSVDVRNILKLPAADVYEYNALDAYHTLELHNKLYPRIVEDNRAYNVYHGLLLPAVSAFLSTEYRGTPVDEQQRLVLDGELRVVLDRTAQALRRETGRADFNPDSPQQVVDYFVNECGYSMLKRTKTSWSADEATLHHLVSAYNDTVAKQLLEYRGAKKLHSTYVEGMLQHISVDGRVHAYYNIAHTVTGRPSSDNPNMQNIPKRKHKEIRRQFVAPPGYVMVSFDYGQIEGRLFGVVSGDPAYCAAIFKGLDIHRDHAVERWGEEVGPKKRNPVKTINFGSFYGGSIGGLAEQSGELIEDVEFLQHLLKRRYPGVFQWQKELLSFEAENGFVESLFGRRRHSPMSYNEKLNAPIQSTASDMTWTAMCALTRKYKMAVEIHDDITFYLPDDSRLEENLVYIGEAMLTIPWVYMQHSEHMRTYLPMQVECALGPNWCDLEDAFKLDSLDIGCDTLEASVERGEWYLKDLGADMVWRT